MSIGSREEKDSIGGAVESDVRTESEYLAAAKETQRKDEREIAARRQRIDIFLFMSAIASISVTIALVRMIPVNGYENSFYTDAGVVAVTGYTFSNAFAAIAVLRVLTSQHPRAPHRALVTSLAVAFYAYSSIFLLSMWNIRYNEFYGIGDQWVHLSECVRILVSNRVDLAQDVYPFFHILPAMTSLTVSADIHDVISTEWHNIVLWRALAEVAEKTVKKGSQVYIVGKIKTRSYVDKDGINKYITEILADALLLLEKKQVGTNTSVQSETGRNEINDKGSSGSVVNEPSAEYQAANENNNKNLSEKGTSDSDNSGADNLHKNEPGTSQNEDDLPF